MNDPLTPRPTDDPDTWLRLLGARLEDHAALEAGEEPPVPVSLDDLLGRGGLEASFDRFVADGVPSQTVATYLAGWYAGGVASLVGLGLAAGRAGFCFDAASVRWYVHTAGWVGTIEATPHHVVVDRDHPWGGRAGIVSVDDLDAATSRSVAWMIELVRPIIEACRSLTRVGAVGLWNEVGDALGSVLSYQTAIEPTDDRVAILERAVDVAGRPWRARPRLWFVDSNELGRLHVIQKGGCCLAYREPHEPQDADDPSIDAEHRAYLERFPVEPGEPWYCSTCSFREPATVADRQVFWHERHRRSTDE
jgi:hypothetical protein